MSTARLLEQIAAGWIGGAAMVWVRDMWRRRADLRKIISEFKAKGKKP